jgi:hypothetical protein
MGASLIAGAFTGAHTGYGWVAGWVTAAGLGLGLAMPPAMNAALSALSPERSGVGNGLIQAMRQVGGAVGVALLGAVVNDVYRAHLPAGVAGAAKDSVAGGVAVAGRLGDPALLESVRAAYTHGMDVSLVVAGLVALAGAVLAVRFLPARASRSEVPVAEQVAAESTV